MTVFVFFVIFSFIGSSSLRERHGTARKTLKNKNEINTHANGKEDVYTELCKLLLKSQQVLVNLSRRRTSGPACPQALFSTRHFLREKTLKKILTLSSSAHCASKTPSSSFSSQSIDGHIKAIIREFVSSPRCAAEHQDEEAEGATHEFIIIIPPPVAVAATPQSAAREIQDEQSKNHVGREELHNQYNDAYEGTVQPRIRVQKHIGTKHLSSLARCIRCSVK